MRTLIGIDPGANYTGVAVYSGDKFVFHSEYSNPVGVWHLIREYRMPLVIVEDFTGTGRLNRHRKRTIEVLGMVYWGCKASAIDVVRIPQQRRLAYVTSVPADIVGKDEIAAAAHVLGYIERGT